MRPPPRTDIVNPESTPATFWDLPNELLFLIIQGLDNPSILNLGLTCRLMNSVALNYFFQANNIIVPGTRFVAFKNQPKETLPALRSALFVKRLSYFDYDLSSEIERMRSEVSDLRMLAARLQSMDVVSIRFPHGERISFPRPWPSQKRLTVDSWYKAVTSLFVTVLEKGCFELHVIGGTQFSQLYKEDTPQRKEPQLTKDEVTINQKRLISVVQESCNIRPRKLSFNLLRRLRRKNRSKYPRAVGIADVNVESEEETSGKAQRTNAAADAENFPAASETGTTLPSKSKLRLREAFIQSDMLLHHPFSQWTLLTLNAASSTIIKLSLKLTREASSTWKIFSATLCLPNLQIFTFTNDLFIPSDVALFTDVEDFLVNHPGIKKLSLYGVGFPPPLAVPRPSFQQLLTIDAHPFYIIWLMNSLSSNRKALPNIRGIIISSDNYTFSTGKPDFDDSLFDSALEAIISFPRNIALTLTFNSKSHIEHWISSHVRAGIERSVISRLVHVTTLSIDNNNWREFTDSTIAIIPDWLQLFPALKYLKFEWEVARNKERLTDPQFLATTAMVCQKLETVEVNWKVYDLRLIRKNLGADQS